MKLRVSYDSYVLIDRWSINYRHGAPERPFDVLEVWKGTKYQWP
jgi:hypothetical protein